MWGILGLYCGGLFLRFETVGIFADPLKPGRIETAQRVVDIVAHRGARVLAWESLSGLKGVEPQSWAGLFEADLLVAIGGDGSILRVAKEVIDRPHVPAVVGVKVGKLGFLSATPDHGLEEFFFEVLEGDCLLQERMMLLVERKKGDRAVQRGAVLNEVVISAHSEVPRLLHLEVHVDGRAAITYSGDGLVFATPTGSTAHALSAGGPIVDAEMEALVVAPICPHTLSNRPLVIHASRAVHVRGAVPGLAIRAVLDGQTAWPMEEAESLHVSIYSKKFPLVYPRQWDLFSVLRQKLQWRGSVVPFLKSDEERDPGKR